MVKTRSHVYRNPPAVIKEESMESGESIMDQCLSSPEKSNRLIIHPIR